MESLEFFLPDIESAEISIDNHLCGFIQSYGSYREDNKINVRIPLPSGNWIILYSDKKLIKIGNLK
jgi:hypothetical protein